MKTTYYYGSVEFGRFGVGSRDTTPLAIIHHVDIIKEFDTPDEAWQFYVDSGGAYSDYVSIDSVDENNVKYELVFKQHR